MDTKWLALAVTIVVLGRLAEAQQLPWSTALVSAPDGASIELVSGSTLVQSARSHITSNGLTISGATASAPRTVLLLASTQIITSNALTLQHVDIAGSAAAHTAVTVCPVVASAIVACDGVLELNDVLFRHTSEAPLTTVGGSVHLDGAGGVFSGVTVNTPNLVVAYGGGFFVRNAWLQLVDTNFVAAAATYGGSAVVAVDAPLTYRTGSVEGVLGAEGNVPSAILIVSYEMDGASVEVIVEVENTVIANSDAAIVHEVIPDGVMYTCILTNEDVFDGTSFCAVDGGNVSCDLPENSVNVGTLREPCAYTCDAGYVLEEESTSLVNVRACAACADGLFESHGACVPCTQCGEGTVEVEACTATTNRVCGCTLPGNATWVHEATCTYVCDDGYARTENGCAECPEGFFAAGGACYECLRCGPFEVETTGCTATENRECGCESVPSGGELLTASGCEWECGVGYVREGSVCVECSAGTYYSVAVGGCVACTASCGVGLQVSGACTRLSDTVCSPCALPPAGSVFGGSAECGFVCDVGVLPMNAVFVDATVSCEWTCVNDTYDTGAGACAACSSCGAGETEATGCTSSVDTQCSPCTSLPEGAEYTTANSCAWTCGNVPSDAAYVDASINCTWTCDGGYYASGNECFACDSCLLGFGTDSTCTSTQNAVCTPCATLSTLETYATPGSCDATCVYGSVQAMNGTEVCVGPFMVYRVEGPTGANALYTGSSAIQVYGSGLSSGYIYTVCDMELQVMGDGTDGSSVMLAVPADVLPVGTCNVIVNSGFSTSDPLPISILPNPSPLSEGFLGDFYLNATATSLVCLFDSGEPLGFDVTFDGVLDSLTTVNGACFSVFVGASTVLGTFDVTVQYFDTAGDMASLTYSLRVLSIFSSCQAAYDAGLTSDAYVPIHLLGPGNSATGDFVVGWCLVAQYGSHDAWLLLQKNWVPHDSKRFYAYGVPDDTHFRLDALSVPWADLLGFDTNNQWHLFTPASTGVSVRGKFSQGQDHSRQFQTIDGFYNQEIGSTTAYMCFDTQTTEHDDDFCRNGMTGSNSVSHDTHNYVDEYLGTSWYSDGTSDYINDNRDSPLSMQAEFRFYVA